jgi:hypothetical protein
VHESSGWYCVGCGAGRAVEEFGEPCVCGEYAMACDELHHLTRDEMKRLAEAQRGKAMEVRPDDGPH